MRAVVVTKQGPPEVLQVVDVDEPLPRTDQIRVRVHGAAVNPADTLLRSGAIPVPAAVLPFVLGMDVAGIVDMIGPDSDTSLQVGDRVMGLTVPIKRGAYADYVVLPPSWVIGVPDGVSLHEAASIPMNGLTALQGIDVMGLTAKDVVAVTGSAGAFAGYLIQLAEHAGITTIADSSSADEALIRSLGPQHIAPRGPGFVEGVRAIAPNGVDAVADGALIGPDLLPAIKDGGIYAGLRGNDGPGTTPLPPPPRGIRYVEFEVANSTGDRPMLEALANAAAQQVITPRIAEVIRPEEAGRAHAALERGGVRGRFVLDFSE